MKFILTLVFGISISIVFSQDLISPNPLSSFEVKETTDGYKISLLQRGITKFKNNHVGYLLWYSPSYSIFPQSLDFFTDVTKGVYFDVVIRDSSLQTTKRVSSKQLELNDEKIFGAIGLYQLSNQNNNFFLLCLSESSGQIDRKLNLFELNQNLEVVSRKKINEPSEYIQEYKSGQITEDEQILLLTKLNIGQPNISDKAFFALDLEGELKYEIEELENFFSNYPTLDGLLELSEKNAIIQPKYIVDRYNQSILCEFNNEILFQNGSMVKLNDDEFLFCGTSFHGTLSVQHDVEIIMKGNSNCTVDTFFYREFMQTPLNFNTWTDFDALSLADRNHIYFLTSRGGYFSEQNNYITVNSLDSAGILNWSFFFGGDASYTPIKCQPLADKSVVVFVLKQQEGEALTIEKAHFTENGELIETTDTELISLNNSAQLYPNPVSNTLHIDCGPQLNNPSLKLFDSFGRLVRYEPLRARQSQVDMSDLAGGVYVYQIWAEGKIVQVGKVVHL